MSEMLLFPLIIALLIIVNVVFMVGSVILAVRIVESVDRFYNNDYSDGIAIFICCILSLLFLSYSVIFIIYVYEQSWL